MYEVLFSKRAIKDRELLKSAGLFEKARALCKNLADDPFRNPPPYEKLVGDLSGSYSRRINVQRRQSSSGTKGNSTGFAKNDAPHAKNRIRLFCSLNCM